MKNRVLSVVFLAAVCLSLCVPARAAANSAEVIPCVYDTVDSFSEGLALVGQEGKCGFIDKTGAVVVPLKYDAAGSFSNGLAAVQRNGKWGYIDKTGKVVVALEYNTVTSFSEGLAAVEQDGKWGFLDTTGAVAVPLRYDAVNSFSEGLAVVRRNWKFGFIDKTGKVVVPLEYDDDDSFSDGLAVVQQGWKYGIIDKTGAVIVPLEYDVVDSFSEGLVRVKRDGKWGYVDRAALRSVSRTHDSARPLSGNTGSLACARTQAVELDGKALTLTTYALKGAGGSETGYVRLRDVAYLLSGTAAEFSVDWDGAVNITTKAAYAPDGSELETPFAGDRAYQENTVATTIDGETVSLHAITLTDDNGGGYTYYKLSDLGEAVGFTVEWNAEQGVVIMTAD